MSNNWTWIEAMFEDEIRSTDFAQTDFDKIAKARVERAEGRDTSDPTLLNLAERGVLQWQAECYQRLGRAVYTLLVDARKRETEKGK